MSTVLRNNQPRTARSKQVNEARTVCSLAGQTNATLDPTRRAPNGGPTPADLQMQLRHNGLVWSAKDDWHTKLKRTAARTALSLSRTGPSGTGGGGQLCDTDATAALAKGSSDTIRPPKEGQRAHDDDNGAPLTDDGKVDGHHVPRSRCCLRASPLISCEVVRKHILLRRKVSGQKRKRSRGSGARSEHLADLPPAPDGIGLAACCSQSCCQIQCAFSTSDHFPHGLGQESDT